MGYFSFGVNMSLSRPFVIAILLAPFLTCSAAWSAQAHKPAEATAQESPQPSSAQSQSPAAPAGSLLAEESGITQAPAGEGKPSDRSDAYYDFTMGHVYE